MIRSDLYSGPGGGAGIPGPPGPPGSGSNTYIFDQGSPASQWNIAHNLAKYPSVTVVDSSKREVYGMITYLDNNNLRLNFLSPFSGSAYLN